MKIIIAVVIKINIAVILNCAMMVIIVVVVQLNFLAHIFSLWAQIMFILHIHSENRFLYTETSFSMQKLFQRVS